MTLKSSSIAPRLIGTRSVPEGHTFRHTDGGVEYLYFATPYAMLRTRTTSEDFERLEQYEAFTCLRDGSRLEEGLIDRDEQGRARYAWRKQTPLVGPADQAKLIAAGKLKADEAWLRLAIATVESSSRCTPVPWRTTHFAGAGSCSRFNRAGDRILARCGMPRAINRTVRGTRPRVLRPTRVTVSTIPSITRNSTPRADDTFSSRELTRTHSPATTNRRRGMTTTR